MNKDSDIIISTKKTVEEYFNTFPGGLETAYAVFDKVQMFYVCRIQEQFVLANKLSETEKDIADLKSNKMEIIAPLTIAQAVRNKILAEQDWSYSPENAQKFLDQYKL